MKTTEQTRRELFEAWYRVNQKKCWEESRDCPYLACFEAFNAALDAVVIEIPALKNSSSYYDGGDVHDDAINKCRTAIESTGLGLKIR